MTDQTEDLVAALREALEDYMDRVAAMVELCDAEGRSDLVDEMYEADGKVIQAFHDLRDRLGLDGEVVEGYIVELDEYAGPDCRYFHHTKGPGEIPEWGIPATLTIHDRHPSTESNDE